MMNSLTFLGTATGIAQVGHDVGPRGLDAASSTRTSAARSMPDLELLEERLLSSVARRMERLCVPSRALAPASARVVSQPELLVA